METTTVLHELADLGQAVWFDSIRRSILSSGELAELVESGVRGVTSNPSIFEKAIAGSADYDVELGELISRGLSAEQIYEALALEDVRLAADLLKPLHEQSDGLDGYVSLEVDPRLALDTDGTVAEARRLFRALDRPNAMIKVPATPAGIPAIEALIAEGIHVNATLIFSIENYRQVARAFVAGLERRAASGHSVAGIASVASFFVSRVDTAVDQALDRSDDPAAADLKGKIAVANSKAAYAAFGEIFSGSAWDGLAASGARVQRVLWASTGTKNPLYPDTHYVDELIGRHTVNTVPPATLNAFLDHGRVAPTLEQGLEEAQEALGRLGRLGVDLDAITDELQVAGVAAFANAFESLMASIAEKRKRMEAGRQDHLLHLGEYAQDVERDLAAMRDERVMQRIWSHDHTVWKPEPTEIVNRLGWLHSPETMLEHLPEIARLVEDVRADGLTDALLLGMGGSSLAPEVFRKVFGVREGHLDLHVLDSTHPEAVLELAERLDPARTLVLVSTKSGGTVETFSFFKFFYNRARAALGAEQAGKCFVAITDPGSKLQEIAETLGFRKTFLNDPNIGGRYSALSYFGLVPAGLVGVDLEGLLSSALRLCANCVGSNRPVEGDNHGALGGAILGSLWAAGRDKLTLIASPRLAPFGAWLEQLIAESLGKEGKGVLPVDGEPVGPPRVYGDDRLFLYLRLEGDESLDAAVTELVGAGHPVVQQTLHDPIELGGELFRWEMITAVAGHRMGINPFDQPNVESAKVAGRAMVAAYSEQGALPALEPDLVHDGVQVVGGAGGDDLSGVWRAFLDQGRPGDYVCLQAYLPPGESGAERLAGLQAALRDRTGLAVTAGFGPRFLHSTGQLHKGDAGRGLFVQLTADASRDADIPDEAGGEGSAMSFGVLIAAQALGDRQALLDAGRRVVRFHLGSDVAAGLERVAAALP